MEHGQKCQLVFKRLLASAFDMSKMLHYLGRLVSVSMPLEEEEYILASMTSLL